MCGIAGSIRFDGSIDDMDWLRNAAYSLMRRGPDSTSIVQDGQIGMVATRLAMLDQKGSTQPIYSTDGRWMMVGNGEIYNFLELRRLPALSEYHYATSGDLEVAMPLLAALGPAGFNLIRGPFALAIWDREQKSLWLIRDAWGERPLFYQQREVVRFASMPTTLGKCPGGRLSLNLHAFAMWLGVGRELQGSSLLDTVIPVPPGTALRVASNGTTIHRFNQTLTSKQHANIDVDGACETFAALFDQAVDRCMVSERPLAVAFSGGLDSTAILLRAMESAEMCAVTISSGRVDDVNSSRATAVAAEVGVQHIQICCPTPSVEHCFELVGRHLAGPAPDPVALHNLALSKAIAGEWAGLLAGHGADEILAGYARYRDARREAAPLNLLHREPLRMLATLPGFPAFTSWPRMREVVHWGEHAEQFVCRDFWDHHSQLQLVNEVVKATSECGNGDAVVQMQTLDFGLLNVHDNCVLPDQSGMAFGVEQRAPFLDRDVVEFALSCPAQCRMNRNQSKFVLRRYLAQKGVTSPLKSTKVGFDDAFEYDKWMHRERLALTTHILEGPLRKCSIFQPSLWAKIESDAAFFDEHLAVIWRLFAASAWFSVHDDEVAVA